MNPNIGIHINIIKLRYIFSVEVGYGPNYSTYGYVQHLYIRVCIFNVCCAYM